MIIVDSALERRAAEGNPIRVGLVGAGFAGRGFALQVLHATPGMDVVAVSQPHDREAEQAYRDAGSTTSSGCRAPRELERAIARGPARGHRRPGRRLRGRTASTSSSRRPARSSSARASRCRRSTHGKHLVLVNAELDCTLGPILKTYADRAGVVFTDTDGDQPAVIMNLVARPRCSASGRSSPATSRACSTTAARPRRSRRSPTRSSSGRRSSRRSPTARRSPQEMASLGQRDSASASASAAWPARAATASRRRPASSTSRRCSSGPVVDYILGAEPSFGVFVLGHSERAARPALHEDLQDGRRPGLHVLPAVPPEPARDAADGRPRRAVRRRGAHAARARRPAMSIALAKRDLKAGETLDGVGGFTCYGVIENTPGRAPGRPAADGPRGRLRPQARPAEGRRDPLRRRRPAAGARQRPALARAGRALSGPV